MRKYLSKYGEAVKVLVFQWDGVGQQLLEIYEGLRALVVFVIWMSIRIVLLFTLPISAALFAVLQHIGDRQQMESEKKAREKMRRNIHKNGNPD